MRIKESDGSLFKNKNDANQMEQIKIKNASN